MKTTPYATRAILAALTAGLLYACDTGVKVSSNPVQNASGASQSATISPTVYDTARNLKRRYDTTLVYSNVYNTGLGSQHAVGLNQGDWSQYLLQSHSKKRVAGGREIQVGLQAALSNARPQADGSVLVRLRGTNIEHLDSTQQPHNIITSGALLDRPYKDNLKRQNYDQDLRLYPGKPVTVKLGSQRMMFELV